MKIYRITATHSSGQTLVTQYVRARDMDLVVAHAMGQWPGADVDQGERFSLEVEGIAVVDIPAANTHPRERTRPTTQTPPVREGDTVKPRKRSPLQGDDVDRADVLRLTGLTGTQISNLVYLQRLQRGGTRGSVTRASQDAFLASGGIRQGKKAARGKKETFVRIEKLAKRLGITEDEVLRVKAAHKIEGGFGWVEENSWMEKYALDQ